MNAEFAEDSILASVWTQLIALTASSAVDLDSGAVSNTLQIQGNVLFPSWKYLQAMD